MNLYSNLISVICLLGLEWFLLISVLENTYRWTPNVYIPQMYIIHFKHNYIERYTQEVLVIHTLSKTFIPVSQLHLPYQLSDSSLARLCHPLRPILSFLSVILNWMPCLPYCVCCLILHAWSTVKPTFPGPRFILSVIQIPCDCH